MYGRDQSKSRQSLEGEDRLVSEFTSKKKNWIESMANLWSSSGKYRSIHYIGDPRRDSQYDVQFTTTLYGEKKRNEQLCIVNSFNVAEDARRFAPGHWSVLGPGSETKWYGRT